MQNKKLLLQQVRESYRFLFDFQSRVLDLMSFVEKKFGVTYRGGLPLFSARTPRSGKRDLDLWAWDWLNFYFYEFHYGYYYKDLTPTDFWKVENRIQDIYGLSVFLISDDGYYQSHAGVASSEDKINLESFLPAEQSGTKLIFVASKNMWNDKWWRGAAGHPKEEFLVKEFDVLKESDVLREGEDKRMVFYSFDLAEFFEEESTLVCLRKFEKLCKENDIVFKLLENKFEEE